MRTRTEELLEKTVTLHEKGWTKRKIAKECGVSPQYIGRLITIYEQNQKKLPEQNYGLSTRVMNCLKRNKIPVNAEAIADSIDLLLCMRGLGVNSLMEIGRMLKGANIIHDVDEWIEGGREKLYNQRKTSFRLYAYDQHVPQIDL